MIYTIKVSKRDGKVNDDDLCMGVVSGAKMDSVPVQFDKKEFKKLYAEAGSTNIISIEGLDESVEATVIHIDRAPFTNEVHHVEFYAIERGVEMSADVPLKAIGEAPAEKDGAIINQLIHTVTISCRPRDLIQELEVDLSLLKEIGDTVFIKDLNIPSAITIDLDPETAVASALAPKQEKKEEEDEEVTEPELVDEKGSGSSEENQTENTE